VVKLIAEGHSSKEIAQQLGHQRQDGRAWACATAPEITRYAIRIGLIQP
jgi:hypothetical protein